MAILVVETTVVSLATPIVTSRDAPKRRKLIDSQFPWSRDAERMTRYLIPLRSGSLNMVKAIVPQYNMFKMNLQISLKVLLVIWHQWTTESYGNGAAFDGRPPLFDMRLVGAGYM